MDFLSGQMQDIPGPQSGDQVVFMSEVFLSQTLQKCIVSLLFWDAQGCVRSRKSENPNMGLVLQDAPLPPSSNYASA